MQNRNTTAEGGEPAGTPLSGDALEAVLVAELGDALVTRAADIDPRYFTAYNEPAGARPRALVRPRSVDDVSRTLALCARLGQAVVLPQG
ncbi:FAD-binding oxidoreductase, partial [Burkholderia multivorans]|nr:FAD-binding oxidoreductase [Burkholderia multivorans]